MSIQPGSKVRDKITGFEGTVTCRMEWLHGCVRILVQPHGLHDGKPIEAQAIDEPQLEVITEVPFAGSPQPGGDESYRPSRPATPSR